MLSLVRNTVIIQCFDAVGWVTGRASRIRHVTAVSRSVRMRTGLTWNNS